MRSARDVLQPFVGRDYQHSGTRALTCAYLDVSERAPIAEGRLVEVADRVRVLGRVVRLRLVEHLAGGSATPQEMADALGYTQQNVSEQLQILYRSGVVARRQDGSSVVYSLKDAMIMGCSTISWRA